MYIYMHQLPQLFKSNTHNMNVPGSVVEEDGLLWAMGTCGPIIISKRIFLTSPAHTFQIMASLT